MKTRNLKTQNKISFITGSCNDSLPLNVRIAILSMQNKSSSETSETLVLIIEYLQLAAFTFLLITNRTPEKLSDNFFQRTITEVINLFNPGFLVTFRGAYNQGLSLVLIVFLLNLLKFLLFGYIIMMAKQNRQTDSILVKIWKWVFKLQGRILYGISTSFWLKVIVDTLKGDANIFEIGKIWTIVLLTTLMTLDFAFSFLLYTRYHTLLSTKSLFSASNRRVEQITLTQKFTLQIFVIILIEVSFRNQWIFVATCIVFTLVRNVYYLKRLPLYNVKGLTYQGLLLMMVTSLDISSCAQLLLRNNKTENSFSFVLLTWMILCLLTMKIFRGYIDNVVFHLAMKSSDNSPDRAILRVAIIKQLNKERRFPTTLTEKYKYGHLINRTVDSNLQVAIDLNLPTCLENESKRRSESKKTNRRILLYYSECILSQLPRKNDAVTLCLARIYAKKLQAYGIAMKMLNKLQTSEFYSIRLNAFLLIWNIQNTIKAKSKQKGGEINLYEYFQAEVQFAQLERRILEQGEIQLNFYIEMTPNAPNLGQMFNIAQKIHKCRQEIKKSISTIHQSIPDYYTRPLLVYAQYSMMLNYSHHDYVEYFNLYSQRCQTYQKYFRSQSLIKENLFQEKTAFFIVSGQKEDLGKIYFCTRSAEAIYGGEASSYINTDISTLIPVNYPNFLSSLATSGTDTTNVDLIGTRLRGYCQNINKYLIEVEFYADVYPFLTRGFYYCVFVKKVPLNKDYLLIHENGTIAGITKIISQRLGIANFYSNGFPHVRIISEDLNQINEAFNHMILNKNNQTEYNECDTPSIMTERDTPKIITPKRRRARISKTLKSRFAGGNFTELAAIISEDSQSRIDPSRAVELYNTYSTGGGKVKLTQLRKHGSTSVSSRHNKPLLYDCKMSILSQEPQLLKLIALEESKNSFMTPKNSEFKSFAERLKQETENIHLSESAQEEENISEFLPGTPKEEKQTGWIDFKALEFPQPKETFASEEKMVTARGENSLATEANLVNPLSTERQSKRLIIPLVDASESAFPRLENKSNYISHLPESEREYQVKALKFNYEKQKGRLEKISYAFDLALAQPYYPKHLKILALIFYLLLSIVVAGQLTLWITSYFTLSNLKITKDILKDTQTRDYNLVTLYRSYRIVWDVQANIFDYRQITSLNSPLQNYFIVSTGTINNLVNLNKNVLLSAGSAYESIKQDLFKKDVRISYTNSTEPEQSFQNFTNFQAIDQVVSAAKQVQASKADLTQAADAVSFIFRNAANDLLIKTEAIAEQFLESIASQTHQRKVANNIFLIVQIIVLVIIQIPSIKIIQSIYLKEVANMSTLTRLNIDTINELQHQLIGFLKTLEADDPVEDKSKLQIFQKSTPINSKKKYVNSKRARAFNTNKILQKYLIYILKAFLVCAVLISLVVLNTLLTSNSVQFLQSEQSKLYFLNSMAKAINLAYLEYRDIFSTNDTSTVRNEPVSIQLQKATDDISQFQSQLSEIFLQGSSDEDTISRGLLYGHNCKFLLKTSVTDYCGYLEKRNIILNLYSLLSTFETFLREKQDKFHHSNRTMDALKAIITEDYDMFLSVQRVLTDESLMLADRTNTIFEERFSKTQTTGELGLIIALLLIILIRYLAWKGYFQQLRESDNEFKNVLQNFPPHLIFSNFILKSYLIRTSGSTLNAIKDDLY